MKEQLCRAFCAQLHVERVPAGWSVQTPYRLPDGDPVMFFIVTDEHEIAHLEDDGATVGLLETGGVSFDKRGARFQAFQDMLDQHDAAYDDDAGVIRTASMTLAGVAEASVNFTALMLRVHDLAMLTVERVKQSWRDDALRDIHARFDAIAEVEEDAVVTGRVSAIPADAVIRFPKAAPVAVILATSNAKGLQALVLKMELEKYQGQDIPVVLLVERAKDNPLAEGTYALAQSRLNGVHTYRGTELDAMAALSRYAPSTGTLQ